MNKTVIIGLLIIFSISIPIGISYGYPFTIWGKTFDSNSECAEHVYIVLTTPPYSLEKIQPYMRIMEGLCDPT